MTNIHENLPGPIPSINPSRRVLFSLRRGMGAWRLRFAGEEAVLKHEQGLLYVAWLLYHPPSQPVHAIELAANLFELKEAESAATSIVAATGCSVVVERASRLQERSLGLDEAEALRRLRRKMRELETVLDDADEIEPVKAEARRELEAIMEYQRGRPGGVADNAQRTVRAVRMAITRLHRHLAVALDAEGNPHRVVRAFAAHVEQHLLFASARRCRRHSGGAGYAGCFTYEPPPEVRWS
jgi:hypothetical protein